MKLRIAILVFDGVEELDFAAPFEVLSAASKLGADLRLDLVSLRPERIVATHGLAFEAPLPLAPASLYDVLVVPGGAWISGGDTGVRRLVREGEAAPILRALASRGTVIASVCTGAFLLAEAGLLEGRPAVTHHSAAADLESRGVELVNARVVDAGPVLTAGGVASGLDLALWLVERFFGAARRGAVEDYLEYRLQGPVHRVA